MTTRFPLCVAAVCACSAAPIACALPPGFVDQPVLSGWNQAVGVTFAPDGRGFVWEKSGRVWLVENGVRSAQPLIDISEEVRDYYDYGLLGFAIDPQFLTNGRIYLLYAVDHYYMTDFGTPGYDPGVSVNELDSFGRVTRYTCNTSDNFHSVDPASRVVLVGASWDSGFPLLFNSHGVGSLAFANDGTLLAGSGDGASWTEVPDNGGPREGSSNTGLADGIIRPDEDVGAFRSQLIDSLAGKVIRVDPNTGQGPPDNPFYDPAHPASQRSRVWALGFRNPYRFTVRPNSATPQNPVGSVYIGDVGWYTREECDVATRGGLNFGWPLFEGLDPTPLYPDVSPQNLFAPNPLANGSSCPGTHFLFRDLLIQEALGTPSWPNPCNPSVQVPASPYRMMLTRPVLAWGLGAPAQVPIFQGLSAASVDLGDPACPVEGEQFLGATSIGGTWYTGTAFGPEFEGAYFFGDFTMGWIRYADFHTDDTLHSVHEFTDLAPAVVSIGFNPADEAIYYLAYGDTGESVLRRIARVGDLAPTAAPTGAPLLGPSPLTVQFTGDGSRDPEGGELTYLWDFGDGSPPSTLPNPSHTFTAPNAAPARFDVTLTVTDPAGNPAQGTLSVSPNNTPPDVEVLSPVDGTLLDNDQPVPLTLAASVSDAQSPTELLTCQWQVILHHNTHTHPQAPLNGCTQDITIYPHGSGQDVIYHEFRLTVTDPQGLSTVRAVSVYPGRCDSIDFNHDDLFPDTLDIDDFLSVFSGGPCSNDPNCFDIDFNNDGLFPDTADIDAFIVVFSGGPCR